MSEQNLKTVDAPFALLVHGDSMVDTSGTVPWGPGNYPDGCMIVIDPTVDAQPGHHVVVEEEGSDHAIFRELQFDGEQYMLKPLNPLYAAKPLLSAKIRGVVVQVQVLTEAGKRQKAKYQGGRGHDRR
jgi:SOS-response transcriptional repressor LexA